MSCYLRHMRDLFEVLGLEYDRANRSRVDSAIRTVIGVGEGASCPQVWSAIKALDSSDREALPAKLSDILG